MLVQSIQQQNNDNKTTPKFNGGVDATLRFFATNQAIGANAVDLTFMVIPRSTNDAVKRGPAAGAETFRREIMGTINDSCIGIFGTVAGAMIAYSINKKFGLNSNKIFASPDTLAILAENKAEQIKNNKTQYEYLKRTLSEVKGYNPSSAKADEEGYVKISKETIDEVAKILNNSLENNVNYD